jgi:hypothetical protein
MQKRLNSIEAWYKATTVVVHFESPFGSPDFLIEIENNEY